jgi:hypothetical protein
LGLFVAQDLLDLLDMSLKRFLEGRIIHRRLQIRRIGAGAKQSISRIALYFRLTL